jgi:Acetyltransferase (GNAT) family.
MDILDLENTVNPAWWIRQLGQCEWAAGTALYRALKENRFHTLYGQKARVLMAVNGTKLAAFCTYAETDDIPDTELTPWIGFVYTFPDYRGRRLQGRLLEWAKELAREDKYDTLWFSSRETGLYEKYGAEYVTGMKDRQGEDTAVYRMDTYDFYGWQGADVKARNADYPGIETPRDLYSALWYVWSRSTCTPRMRENWSEENRTLGQCAITAFLTQDIFGGRIWGVPLGDGNYHCFNAVGDCVFDLTSAQFGRKLNYALRNEQLRHDHFQREEKRIRYEALKAALSAFLSGKK